MITNQSKKLWLWNKFSLSVPEEKYREEFGEYGYWIDVNLLTPMSDQDVISPHQINTTISNRQVTRIEKNISKGIISWFNTKFSELTS